MVNTPDTVDTMAIEDGVSQTQDMSCESPGESDTVDTTTI